MGNSRKEPKTVHPFRVGTSDIVILPGPPGVGRIRLPVPPSVNVRQRPVYRVRGGRRTIELGLTPVAANYYLNALPLRMAWRKIMTRPLEDYTKFKFRFFLGNMGYDTHNGLKIACDTIQKSGLILNDKYILPQVERPESAPADPRMIIEFPILHPHMNGGTP